MTSICYISPLAIHSERWIGAFAQREYDTFLISDSKTWVAPPPKSTRVFTLQRVNRQTFAKRFLPNSISILKTLKKLKPDIVNLHVQHHYSPAIVLSRCPFVLTSWGLEVFELQSADSLTRTLAKMTASFAGRIVVDAECLKEIWMETGVPENKVEVIPFGVDTTAFRPNRNKAIIRKALQIKQSDVVVISTRPFLNDHYNVECLIKSMPLVLKHHKNVKLVLKGTGPLEAYFRHLVKKLKISSNVRFVGLTSHSEVADYLAASDIYVSTCFLDSTSVSLLEAMACGLPPVVTDIPGNREWINDEVNGSLFPPTDSKALSEKIIHMIKNKNARKRFGDRCLRIVKNRASWEACVNKMEAIYQSLL